MEDQRKAKRSRHRVSAHRQRAQREAQLPTVEEEESDVETVSLPGSDSDYETSYSQSDGEEYQDAAEGDDAENGGEEKGEERRGPGRRKGAKKKHTKWFDAYLTKTLHSVSEVNTFSKNVRSQLNSILIHLATLISQKAIDLTLYAKMRTVTMRTLITATRFVLDGKLAEMADELARRALMTYFADQIPEEEIVDLRDFEACLLKKPKQAAEGEGGEKKKAKSRQTKAGLLFSAALAEYFLRGGNSINFMVNHCCPIYLAAVLEYFTAELLILTCSEATAEGRLRLQVRDMVMGVRKDAEFNAVFVKNRMEFLSNTVLPYIPSNMQGKLDRPYAKGMVALQSKGDCVVGSRMAVDHEMRAVMDVELPLGKLGKDAATYMQYVVEQEMLTILRSAAQLADHADHSKVTAADIEMVLRLRSPHQTP